MTAPPTAQSPMMAACMGLDDVDARELALGLSAADACLALAEVRIDCRGTPLNARM